ncbi:DNA helicase [Kaistia adipata]|uniref:DNA helicase n=1 Tax=Kaistia adipata TaxID=166954 RepID=UPI0004249707|nr:DNA helicase [Kaistia adipata]
MTPSAPIHRLKRDARLLARSAGIPLHAALDRIAAREGYSAWSLLAARAAALTPAEKLHARLAPGDLVLVGARPRQGKTLMGLQLARAATRAGQRSVFFTLEYTEAEIRDRLAAIGAPEMATGDQFAFDCSDAIDAGYIMRQLATAPAGTLAVIDYLQLLDQRRDSPPLADQVRALRAFARDRGLILVFISQIDRSFDPALKPLPDLGDVRLPNPLDLSLFDRTCFLHGGEIRFQTVA